MSRSEWVEGGVEGILIVWTAAMAILIWNLASFAFDTYYEAFLPACYAAIASMIVLAFVVAIDYLTFEYFLHRADVLERAKRDWADFVKRGKAEARA